MTQPEHSPRVLLFDVNETLLDTAALKQKIGDILLDARAGSLWFTTMLHYSLVMTVAQRHAALPEIGAATLQMLARNADIELGPEDAKAALSVMRSLPAHPDVKPGLRRLKEAGFRLATLTNSSQAGVAAQIQHAGLSGFFERQLSVEPTGKFKPHQAVYEWAAREMRVEAGQCMLVAAHGWDIAGAKWAGLQAAFIAREGQQKFPLAPPPDLDASDLSALAAQLCG
jgi:2-haloacid dehalogenase